MEAGLGDPVVFLHGWGLSPRAYAAGLLPICAGGLRLIAPSLPGFGGSAELPVRGRGLDGYARHVAALLDALPLDKPAFVVGHSFGGGVGIELARLRPDLVRSLTLVNSIGGSPGRRGLSRGSWLGWALGALTELHPPDLLRLAPGVLRDLVPNLYRHPLTAGSTAVIALTASLTDEAAGLVDAGLPVLFIWSDRDRLVAPGPLREVVGALPAETVSGRHGWLMSSPGTFAELLRNALTVHAMLERRERGQAVVLPAGTRLADLVPQERRRRARHVRPPGR
jgi:pimeloyl-ACP methyl ester carboxylesterase